jgi:hypothetical protein
VTISNPVFAQTVISVPMSALQVVMKNICGVFQKELYNFESLYKFIQMAFAVLLTLII